MKRSCHFPDLGKQGEPSATPILANILFGLACVALPVAIAAQPQTTNSSRTLPATIDASVVREGQKLFHGAANCSRCHGENGAGTFFAPSLNDDRRLNLQTASYDEINRLIHTGVPRPKRHLGAMPPMGGAKLSEDQIRALAAYVFTLDRGR